MLTALSPAECKVRLRSGTGLVGVQVGDSGDKSGTLAPITLTVRRWWSLTYQSDTVIHFSSTPTGTALDVTSELRIGVALWLLIWWAIWFLVALLVRTNSARVFFIVVALLAAIPVAFGALFQARYARRYVEQILGAKAMT